MNRISQFSSKINQLAVSGTLIASSFALAAMQPAYAGIGDIRMGGADSIRLVPQINIKDPTPDVSIATQAAQAAVVNMVNVTRNLTPNVNIDTMRGNIGKIDTPRMSIMPVMPQLTPIIPQVNDAAMVKNDFSSSIKTASLVLPTQNTRNIQVSPTVANIQALAPINANISFNLNTPKIETPAPIRREARGAAVQIAAFPAAAAAANQINNASPTDTNASAINDGAASGKDASEIQSQLQTAKGLGSVVTNDIVEDVIDKEALNKAMNERIALFEGTTLFIPEKDMVVKTRHGQVNLKAKSVVLVTSSDNELAVYDIHDDRKGATTVTFGDMTFKLAPGRHVVITTNESGDFAMANAIELIPHTDVVRAETGESHTAWTSEFSIPAAINSVNALKSITVSDNPDLQKVSGKIMKTAAILLHMRGGAYKHYLRPRVTMLSQN